jgi:hypothetical protein
MMRRDVTVGIIVAFLAFATAPAHADGTSSPGKFAAAQSVTGFVYDPPATEQLTVQLLKGKRKRLLFVTGRAATAGAPNTSVLLGASLNSVPMEPQGGLTAPVCRPVSGSSCSVEATWWVDLDAAELAAPGSIINQPLTVVLTVGIGSTTCVSPGNCPGATMDASVTVQQVKK